MGTKSKRATILLGGLLVLTLSLLLTTIGAQAAPLVNVPVTVTQPDGQQVALLATGDEYYNWLHDAQGYTVMQDPGTGYYVYANLVKGALVPTKSVAGRDDPAAAGLSPHLNISPEKIEAIRQAFVEQTALKTADIRNAPRTGTITNLVVFIRFAGEPEFTDATSVYTYMLNDATAGANSLRNYYREVSYNALTIDSGLYPAPPAGTVISYQDSHGRGYYQPYSETNKDGYTGGDLGDMRRLREHTLLKNAINGLSSTFPDAPNIDADNDGFVDSMTFVVHGDVTGWNSLLWPHMWSLYSYDVRIHDKQVGQYSFHLQTTLNTGVLAHEMFHVLGAPDLYHYYTSGTPTGFWDVMEYDANPPQHMSCYMKYRYGGWISGFPVLAAGSTYTLNPSTSSTNNCYKIRSPYSTAEYFVTEYRKAEGTFESSLPGSGLLVWRIDSRRDGSGNAYGPPDEVYVYRPGGKPGVDGNIYEANFSIDEGRTRINDATNPSSFLQNGGLGGLDICSVGSSAGSTISFNLGGTCQVIQPVRSSGGQDGWILETGELTNAGGSLSATGPTLRLGDGVGRQQYRAVLSFPTGAALPDGAVITKVTLTLRRQAVSGLTNPFSLFQGMYIEVRRGFFGTSAALQSGDFQLAAPRIVVGPYKPALAGGVYTINLPKSSWPYFNKLSTNAGLTQLRLRFKLDDNNDSIANFISFYSGNHSNSSYKPRLTITYYVP